jgi:type IV pilus assembly protein PilV
MKTTRHSNHARRSAGFALIEVMVAVLLFAIGILGLVGLQASMTQAQTDSKVRADAANLVDELATLMWAEVGNKAVMANLADYTTSGCVSNARCGAWLSKVGKALPGGTLSDLAVTNTANTYDENHGSVTVTLTWKLPNSGVDHKYIATFNVAQNPPAP